MESGKSIGSNSGDMIFSFTGIYGQANINTSQIFIQYKNSVSGHLLVLVVARDPGTASWSGTQDLIAFLRILHE